MREFVSRCALALLVAASAQQSYAQPPGVDPIGQPISYRLELLTVSGGAVPTSPAGGALAFMVTGGVRFNEVWALYARPTFSAIWGEGPSRLRALFPVLFEGRIAWGAHLAAGPSLDLALDPSFLVRPGLRLRAGVCVFSIGTTGCFESDQRYPNDNADISLDLDVHTSFLELNPTTVELTVLLGVTARWNY